MHQDHRSMTPSMQRCIEACFSCASICDRCSDDMIGMDTDKDNELMLACIRLCQDCADICMLSARWMSRMSSSAEMLCRLCADICERCAETCERHAPQHALCGECAAECRRCAGLCRQMAGVAA
jgi:hypothetical protein